MEGSCSNKKKLRVYSQCVVCCSSVQFRSTLLFTSYFSVMFWKSCSLDVQRRSVCSRHRHLCLDPKCIGLVSFLFLSMEEFFSMERFFLYESFVPVEVFFSIAMSINFILFPEEWKKKVKERKRDLAHNPVRTCWTRQYYVTTKHYIAAATTTSTTTTTENLHKKINTYKASKNEKKKKKNEKWNVKTKPEKRNVRVKEEVAAAVAAAAAAGAAATAGESEWKGYNKWEEIKHIIPCNMA